MNLGLFLLNFIYAFIPREGLIFGFFGGINKKGSVLSVISIFTKSKGNSWTIINVFSESEDLFSFISFSSKTRGDSVGGILNLFSFAGGSSFSVFLNFVSRSKRDSIGTFLNIFPECERKSLGMINFCSESKDLECWINILSFSEEDPKAWVHLFPFIEEENKVYFYVKNQKKK
ncbi:MAG: hypothetical protein NUV46_01805 [Nanoarchaeota archaeon]|nr:hypothetical protein [Nanoarchaeota archaeon]